MNKNDCIEKIFFIVCVTFLGMLFAFFRFGGIEVMKKCDGRCIAVAVIGVVFIIVTIIALFCCCEENTCNINTFSCYKDFPIKKLNKSYFVDKNNKSVPDNRTIIFVRDDVNFNDINFSAIEKIEEIYFCDSEISILAEKLQKLKNVRIFLDGGKSKIEIIHTEK